MSLDTKMSVALYVSFYSPFCQLQFHLVSNSSTNSNFAMCVLGLLFNCQLYSRIISNPRYPRKSSEHNGHSTFCTLASTNPTDVSFQTCKNKGAVATEMKTTTAESVPMNCFHTQPLEVNLAFSESHNLKI